DVTRFKIVLGNLISNARQYADWDKQNPFIKINYRKENGSLIVSVKDNGKGIQNDHLTKIFEMFFRIDNDAQGSGLGLYIVKEATEKMGGTIKVTSEKGVGSEFTISIPAAS
ncbi:MAG: sensor histidine kinase, partial [Bacteroidota bacterium]